MARTQYTVTFPAARAGDAVTWPDSVKIYPDASTPVPLQPGQSLDESLSFSGYSESASVVFTRPAGDNDTVTVTTGAPTGEGAAAAETAGGSVPPFMPEQYALNLDSSGTGFAYMEWAYQQWPVDNPPDPTLLDLTDPTQPTVIADGLYLFTGFAHCGHGADLTATNQVFTDLEMDVNGADYSVVATMYPSSDAAGPGVPLAICYRLSAGMVLGVGTRSSVALAQGLRGNMWVTKLA